MNNRNSKYELLRIIAMFGIFVGHIGGEGGVVSNSEGLNQFACMMLSSGLRISVNVFLLIGLNFMIGWNKLHSKSVLKIYVKMAFWSILLSLVMMIVRWNGASKSDIVRGFFPYLGRPLWFGAAYVTLILLSPYLKKILDMDLKSIKTLSIILFGSVCIVSSMPGFKESYLADMFWFCCVYIIFGYIKKRIFLK